MTREDPPDRTPGELERDRQETYHKLQAKFDYLIYEAKQAKAALRTMRNKLGIDRRGNRRRMVTLVNAQGEPYGSPYESIKAAAFANGLTPSGVGMAIKNGSVTRSGLRFCFVGKPFKANIPPRQVRILRQRDQKRFEALSHVLPAHVLLSKSDYKRELKKLTAAVKLGMPYRGEIYIRLAG